MRLPEARRKDHSAAEERWLDRLRRRACRRRFALTERLLMTSEAGGCSRFLPQLRHDFAMLYDASGPLSSTRLTSLNADHLRALTTNDLLHERQRGCKLTSPFAKRRAAVPELEHGFTSVADQQRVAVSN